MSQRFEYRLSLPASSKPAPPGSFPGLLRHPTSQDEAALAALMLDAYRGTIDYDGETLEDALAEVRRYFADPDLPALLDCSWVYETGDALACACLVSLWRARQAPLIAYIMTAAAWKGHALAGSLLAGSLDCLAPNGYAQVRAVITSGNLPSERLFTRLGFVRLAAET